MFLKPKEYEKLPANHQKLRERPGRDSLSQAPEGTNSDDIVTQASRLQNCETIHSCCFALLQQSQPTNTLAREQRKAGMVGNESDIRRK